MFKNIRLLLNYAQLQYCYAVETDPVKREAFLGTMMIDLDNLSKIVYETNIHIVTWIILCSFLSIFTAPYYTIKFVWYMIKTKWKK
jgi:hypothetical protein